jgi:hypothetical protein
MYCKQRKQTGGSVFGLISTLAIIAIGAYIGVQYIPQRIEFSSVEAVLENLRQEHLVRRVVSMQELQRSIDNQLNINQMNDLKRYFKVTHDGGMYVIKVSYERELNLIYTTKQVHYNRSLALK